MKKYDKALELLSQKITMIEGLVKPISNQFATLGFNVYKMRQDVSIDILNRITPVESLDYDTLFKCLDLCVRLGEVNSIPGLKSGIEMTELFTEIEIREFSKKFKVKEKDKTIIIPSGKWFVTDMFPHYYITIHTDSNEVLRWRNNNIIRYNPETQRDLLEINSSGGKTFRLDINKNSINDMVDAMLKNEYYNVQGTLNINPDYNDVNIKFSNGDLIIPSEVKIDIIEGFHNYFAITSAKDKEPNWDIPCEYRIYFLDTQSAKAFITQMDKKNHFKESQIRRIDVNDPKTITLNHINNNSSSIFKGKLDENDHSLIYNILKPLNFENQRDLLIFNKLLLENILEYSILTDKTDMFDKYEWIMLIYLTYFKTQESKILLQEFLSDLLGYCRDNFNDKKASVDKISLKNYELFIKEKCYV